MKSKQRVNNKGVAKYCPHPRFLRLFKPFAIGVPSGTRTHDIQNHNLPAVFAHVVNILFVIKVRFFALGQVRGKTAQFCIFSSFSSMLLMKPLMLAFRSCPVHGFIGSPTR